ncbi:MAG: PRC-barrel domain-containing protein [Candidatus Delongbacteria bacterium]
MLYKLKTIRGYKLHSRDGDIGSAEEFYFDDHHWTVRYLVANTGGWLTGRQVLISPYALISIHPDAQTIGVSLTRRQIENSPDLSTDKPISRQFELTYYDYYGWPMYWSGQHMWGYSPAYPFLERDKEKWPQVVGEQAGWDPHLRSSRDVTGHVIMASDGEIGHVEDFILDDESWAIRYLVVDTTNWWPGGRVLVSPQWIEEVSWEDQTVHVALTRATIRQSPEYSEQSLLSRDYEHKLHHHYQSRDYWTDQPGS